MKRQYLQWVWRLRWASQCFRHGDNSRAPTPIHISITRLRARSRSRWPRPQARTAARIRTSSRRRQHRAFDMATWKYGHDFDAPPNAKIWNPVKIKMMKGEKVTGGTVFIGTDPETYCAMANAGYDFIWTEMQHDPRDWEAVGRMWAACPHAKAVPGVRVAYTDEREIQHATDLGALVIVDPHGAFAWKRESRAGTGRSSRRSASAAPAVDRHFVRILGRRSGRISRHGQRQHRADRDDRDARWRAERARDRFHPWRDRAVRGQRRPGQFLRLCTRDTRLRAADQCRS